MKLLAIDEFISEANLNEENEEEPQTIMRKIRPLVLQAFNVESKDVKMVYLEDWDMIGVIIKGSGKTNQYSAKVFELADLETPQEIKAKLKLDTNSSSYISLAKQMTSGEFFKRTF